MELFEKAPAKLNLSLDVLALRSDGYHDLRTVMQSIDLCDELSIATGGGEFTVKTNFSFLPDGDKNLAVRAARLFCDSTGADVGGVSINLRKRIPVGAGMAGGSADAAAVLRALDRGFGTHLGYERLCGLALELGSDVPYCISGGTVLAEGRGELFTPLPPMPPCHIVVCKPRFAISTKLLFERIDSVKSGSHPDTAGIVSAIEAGALADVARRMYNVFEDALPRRFSEIADIKRRMIDGGALGSCMTGTGSAVFGIYDNENAARRSLRSLSAQYQDCFLTAPIARY